MVEEVGYLDPLLKPAELINTLNKNINVFLLVELNDLRFFFMHIKTNVSQILSTNLLKSAKPR